MRNDGRIISCVCVKHLMFNGFPLIRPTSVCCSFLSFPRCFRDSVLYTYLYTYTYEYKININQSVPIGYYALLLSIFFHPPIVIGQDDG
jgi:hypothetical protein